MFIHGVTPMGVLEMVRHIICVRLYPSLFFKYGKSFAASSIAIEKTPSLKEIEYTQTDMNMHVEQDSITEDEEGDMLVSLHSDNLSMTRHEDDGLDGDMVIIQKDVEVTPVKKRKQYPFTNSEERKKKKKKKHKRQKTTKTNYYTIIDTVYYTAPKLLYFMNDIYRVNANGVKPDTLVHLIDHWIVNDDSMIEWKVESIIVSRDSRRKNDKVVVSWFEKECNLIKYRV
jgi:hypothetical protein